MWDNPWLYTSLSASSATLLLVTVQRRVSKTVHALEDPGSPFAPAKFGLGGIAVATGIAAVALFLGASLVWVLVPLGVVLAPFILALLIGLMPHGAVEGLLGLWVLDVTIDVPTDIRENVAFDIEVCVRARQSGLEGELAIALIAPGIDASPLDTSCWKIDKTPASFRWSCLAGAAGKRYLDFQFTYRNADKEEGCGTIRRRLDVLTRFGLTARTRGWLLVAAQLAAVAGTLLTFWTAFNR